jgi:hypothetical protein
MIYRFATVRFAFHPIHISAARLRATQETAPENSRMLPICPLVVGASFCTPSANRS